MTRVLILASDGAACGLYRSYWPAAALVRQGRDVRVQRGVRVTQSMFEGSVTEILDDCDVVVLQRPTASYCPAIIKAAQRQGIRACVEIDDHFGALHHDHVARTVISDEFHPRWMAQSAEIADNVVVTTPSLGYEYAQHGRVSMIGNFLHHSHRRVAHERASTRPRIGWPGTLASHPGDLEVLGDSMRRVCEATDAYFVAFGGKTETDPVFEALQIPRRCRKTQKWAPIGIWGTDAYAEALSRLDVALAPLAPTLFNECKSWLKPLEALGAGCAVVASPTWPYRTLMEHVGVVDAIADGPDEWFRLVMGALERRDSPLKLSETVSDLTIDNYCGDFWTAWTGVQP